MPVVYIDPYIQGAATHSDTSYLCSGTDTVNYNTSSSRIGSWANPFRWDDWRNTNQSASSVNGRSILSNTEVRIKGKTMADMTLSLGQVYFASQYLYPATGNTDFANNFGSSDLNRWFYFSGSNIDAMYPTGVDKFPLILRNVYTFTQYGTSNTRIYVNSEEMQLLAYAVQGAGFNSASSPFCTAYGIKKGYTTAHALFSGDAYHWFNMGGRITKVSAGWTSETEQNGYSLMVTTQADTYERQRFTGTSVHFDMGRGALINRSNRCYYQFIPQKTGVTHKLGYLHVPYTTYVNSGIYLQAANVSCITSLIVGDDIQLETSANNTTDQINLCISGQNGFRSRGNGNSNSVTKVGSIYQNTYTYSTQQGFVLKENLGSATYEFLNGSSYYSRTTSSVNKALTSNRSDYANANHIYPTVVYRTGEPSGHWLANSTEDYNPSQGEVKVTNQNFKAYANTLSLTSSNWWLKLGLSMQTMFHKMPVHSVGKLICGGQNYKTTTNQLGTVAGINYSTTSTVFPPIFGCETNDYDDSPIMVIPDGGGNATSAVLAYNETVNSNSVVVLQNGGTGNGGYFFYPIEIQVPTSFDPSTDSLRVKIVISRTSNATNTVVKYFSYRKDDADDNTYVATSNIGSGSISTDQSNPTAIIHNVSISASGDKKINSVLYTVRFAPSKNLTTEKLYIHDAYAETY